MDGHVRVNLRRSVGLSGGQLYGPGEGILVPVELARAIGASPQVDPPAPIDPDDDSEQRAGTDPNSDPAGSAGSESDGPGEGASAAGDPPAPIEAPELPTIAKLAEVLAGISDRATIMAMAEKDDRVSAIPLYDARLRELA